MKINLLELLIKILPMFLAAGTFAITLQYLILKLERKIREKHGESSEERIERLTKSLREASSLSSEIELEINRRQRIVEKLKNDSSRFDKLAKFKALEVEAVVQTMRGEFKREGKKSLIFSVIINFIFFFAGLIVSKLFT